MPQSKEGHKQPQVDEVNLTTAVYTVQNKGMLVRVAAKHCNVSRTTHQRHLEDHIKNGKKTFVYTSKCAVWTVFSGEENKFIDYITTASNMHYGLSRKKVMELAYKFAKETSKNMMGYK
jgi:hypothetical protein